MLEHITEGCQCQGKKCTKCQIIKCTGAFSRDRTKPDELQSPCKQCNSKVNKDYRSKNKEKIAEHKREHANQIRERRRRSYAENPERYKRKNKNYHAKHKEKIHQRKKMYRQRNVESLREKGRMRYLTQGDQIRARNNAYYRRNDAKIKDYRRIYFQENRDKLRDYARAYWQSHPLDSIARHHKRRAYKLQAGGTFTPQEWEMLLDQYDYTCLRCGRNDVKLTADHVIPLSKGGTNYISNIQPLCKSCNSYKGVNVTDYRILRERNIV